MYINTPYNYTGSKFKLLPQILPLFDYTKSNFIDLFTGSFVVSTNIIDKYQRVIANDIIRDLIRVHERLIANDREFVEYVKGISIYAGESKGNFMRLRDRYNEYSMPEDLYGLMLSSNNNMIRFNKKLEVNSTWGRRCFNKNTQKKIDIFMEHMVGKGDRITFYSEKFYDVPIMEDSFVYCDPPYSNSDAPYNTLWKKEDDLKLYQYLIDIHNKNSTFMLSGLMIHDNIGSKLIEKLLNDGFNFRLLDYNYEKVSKRKKVNSQEIVIFNY